MPVARSENQCQQFGVCKNAWSALKQSLARAI
jgi:hypothetical protein